jgi:hypothetical protein
VRKGWIALGAAGAAGAALTASAVSAPVRQESGLYAVSLVGSQRAVATRNGTTTDDLGCTVAHSDRDKQTITFASHSRRTLTIGASGLPLLRFAVLTRVSGSFHRETRSAGTGGGCASPPLIANRSCGPARLRARLVLRPTGGARMRFEGGFVRTADRRRCATTLTRPDAFVVASAGRLRRSAADAAQVSLHGHVVQRTSVAGGIAKTTTVDWKLVLTRLR